MSGAVRAARAAWSTGGTRCEVDVPVLAVATPRRAPRVAGPSTTTTVVARARLSLVMPTDAAMHGVVTAAVGQVSGSSGTAKAGVC